MSDNEKTSLFIALIMAAICAWIIFPTFKRGDLWYIVMIPHCVISIFIAIGRILR